MTLALRDYQERGVQDILGAWDSGARNVCYRLPTGGGKTVVLSHIVERFAGQVLCIAHRQELVAQMALTLARNGIPHDLCAPAEVLQACVGIQRRELGVSFVARPSRVVVGGVDTLLRRERFPFSRVGLWILDEGHHLLRDNKWGQVISRMPQALGLGVTATPERADGKGLGRHSDGLYDALVHGPEMRELIGTGYLTRYKILAPRSDIDLSSVGIGSTGDYSTPQLRKAVHRSHIVGDIVGHYIGHAAGKLGVTFAVDIEHAKEITEAYNKAGVPAALVTAESPAALRAVTLARFRNRELLQLVNVDLFGEGFDLPAIEVVSFGRPTASYPLYVQQFGRCLRLMDGKDYGLILDHVGNVRRHGLPDTPRVWTLDARERRSSSSPSDKLPVAVCPMCTAVYYRHETQCPECGHIPEPAGRSKPEEVDGDLVLLDEAALAAIEAERAKVDGPPRIPYGVEPRVAYAIRNRHQDRQAAQASLRAMMETWGGRNRDEGRSIREGQKLFFARFGIDVLTAQTLGAREAGELEEKVRRDLE